eukprot:4746188-Pyramimonas_sp.AAC.1
MSPQGQICLQSESCSGGATPGAGTAQSSTSHSGCWMALCASVVMARSKALENTPLTGPPWGRRWQARARS